MVVLLCSHYFYIMRAKKTFNNIVYTLIKKGEYKQSVGLM